MAGKKNMSAAQKAAGDKFKLLIDKEFPLPEVDGIGFRWVNADTRNKKGWSIWAPVEVSSDLGEKVMSFIREKPVFEANPGMVQGNLFRAGDNTLAWASKEMIIELRKHNSQKAGKQVSQVLAEINEDDGKPVTVRNVRRVQLTKMHDE